MFCRKCQGLIDEGQAFCPRCYTVVKQPSILRRLFEKFAGWCGVSFGGSAIGLGRGDSSIIRTNITYQKTHRITVRDETTGELREYTRIEDVPQQYRDMMDSLRQPDAKAVHKEITIRGSDGIERSYSSMEEVPPEMRRLIERFTKP